VGSSLAIILPWLKLELFEKTSRIILMNLNHRGKSGIPKTL